MAGYLYDLEDTIANLEIKIAECPDPYLSERLEKLVLIRTNSQSSLVEKAKKDLETRVKGGFRGYGIP